MLKEEFEDIKIEAIIPCGNHEDGKFFYSMELNDLSQVFNDSNHILAFRLIKDNSKEILSDWIIIGFPYTQDGNVIPKTDAFPPVNAIDLDCDEPSFLPISDSSRPGYTIKPVYRTYAAPALLYVMTNKNPILVDPGLSDLDECEKKANELLDRVFNPSGPKR